jgi:putative ABC transport system permease protein
MAAFLVPLLTIFGLKDGIVGTLENRLLSDPRTLELTSVGHPNFPPSFFEDLARDPDVTYVVPDTRELSNFIHIGTPGREPLRVETVPTSAGDPLAGLASASAVPGAAGRDPGLREVYLSQPAAEALGAGPGSAVTGTVSRTVNGFVERAQVELRVLGVVPGDAVDSPAALASLPLMRAAEDYRSGFGNPMLGWEGGDPAAFPPEGAVFQRFRLYARDLDAVGRLRERLEGQGVMVKARSAEIQRVRTMDTAFSVVVLTLLCVVGAGAFASAASGSVDQVLKNRRSLACLALLGLGRRHLLAFSSFLAAFSGFLASLLAGGLFLATARILNYLFMGSIRNVERFCQLSWGKLAFASGAVVVFMIAASLAAYSALSDIEPSEGMRDV